jgi:hypothetical protein
MHGVRHRPLGGALRFVDHGPGLHWFPFWTFSDFDGGLHQILNAGRRQSRRPRGPDVPDQFAVTAQAALRIREQRAEVEPEVHSIRVRGRETNACSAGP